MSLTSRLFTGAIAVSAFAFAVSAQDKTAKPADGDAKEIHKGKRHDGLGGQREGRMGRRGPGFELRGVNLTDAQKEQIRQIHEANKPSQALRDEMRAIHEARRNGTLTAEQKARMETLRDEAKQKAKSVHGQVLNVLTAEQKAQLQQRRTEMRQRMDERRQKMQERRQQRDLERSKDTTKDTIKVT